jgi:hypothetical protein
VADLLRERQGRDGTVEIVNGRIGIMLHARFDAAVTHRQLDHSQRESSRREHRTKRRSQSMWVDHVATTVELLDPCQLQVSIEYLVETGWNSEKWSASWIVR